MRYIPVCCEPEFLHAHEIFLAARRTAIGNGGSGVTIAISTTATGYGRGFRASNRICFCGLLGCLFSKTFLDKREWTRARIGQKQWFKVTIVVPNSNMRQKSEDQQELKRRRAPLTCFEADGGILSGQSRESGLEKVDWDGVSGRESG
jgi:hypothetical protein